MTTPLFTLGNINSTNACGAKQIPESNLTGLRTRGALGYFLGEYVPPWTPNWHPVLEMGQCFILRSRKFVN